MLNRRTVYFSLAVAFVVLLAMFWGLYFVNSWFNSHQFKFQIPVEFRKPIWVERRAVKLHSHEAIAKTPEPAPEYANPVEQMIYSKFAEKFGAEVGNLAVAVSWAENGTRQCDRISKPNKNGTTDFGLWQINTIHLKRFKLADVIDCEKSTDIALQIYTEQGGFQAWVGYTSGAYKKYRKG